MKITKEEIRHVARLARLRLDEDQLEAFAVQLNEILQYMDCLNELDTRGVEPTFHAVSLKGALREDLEVPSLPRAVALDNAPQEADDLFLVPRVI